MTISSITSTSPLSSIAATTGTAAAPAAPPPAAGTQLSAFGSFMSKLQSLEQTDPAKAKTVLATIAQKLGAKAQQVGGAQGQKLQALADKFNQAAQTGDLSALKPPASGQPGGGHHHHGGGGHHKASYEAGQQNGESVIDIMTSTLDGATSSSKSTSTSTT
ncbi:MAG TPA: hypothetical protein VLX92_19600 [Kofleriaceae bacterium]|nr:hypothetical protein [Kofleriaceae bacterium]